MHRKLLPRVRSTDFTCLLRCTDFTGLLRCSVACFNLRHAEYRRREDEVKFQLQELTKGLAFYKRLGLEFEHLSDRGLTLIFTQIDALHPARRFTFDVGIAGESDAYVISNVEPPVPGMDGMVAALNADGDFGRFTREMRRRFVELAPLTRK